MAVEAPTNWTSFTGGDDGTCDVSTPTITVTSPVSGYLECEGAAEVELTVTGGIGPYSWGTTLGVLDSATGSVVHLTPPTNPYSGATGTPAYSITTKVIGTFCACLTSISDCYGTKYQTCIGTNACTTCYPNGCTCTNCTTASDAVCDSRAPYGTCGKAACSGSGCPEDNGHCFCILGTGQCQPCAITMNAGAVVTVTDSLDQTDVVTIYSTPRTTI
jgi:hypothetical protein